MPSRRRKRKNPEELLPWEHFGGPPSYKAAHGGLEPRGERKTRVSEPGDNRKLIALGRLKRLDYETDKGEGRAIYFHHLRAPFPLLCYGSDDGKLYVVGGGYKVTARGIVG